MSIPQMRTAEQVFNYIKEQDPNTAISQRYIRKLIHERRVPVTSVGPRKLVDLTAILTFIARGDPSVELNTDDESPRIEQIPI